MIHLKKFNEEIGNSKLLEFYNEYKNLFVGEYDSVDLYDTIGDLCVQHYMTKQEVKQVLDTFDCSFDVDKLLKETYDNWTDGEDWRSDLTRKITKEDIIDIIKSNTAEDAADEILEIMSIMTSTSGR